MALVRLGQLITTACPNCSATFDNVHLTLAHVAADHLGGLTLGRMHALGMGFNLALVMEEGGVTELIGLRMLLQQEDQPGQDPETKVFDFIEVMFTEDACRQLGEYFTQMADPAHRQSLREAGPGG